MRTDPNCARTQPPVTYEQFEKEGLKGRALPNKEQRQRTIKTPAEAAQSYAAFGDRPPAPLERSSLPVLLSEAELLGGALARFLAPARPCLAKSTAAPQRERDVDEELLDQAMATTDG
jgi:hypothetical protein